MHYDIGVSKMSNSKETHSTLFDPDFAFSWPPMANWRFQS